MSDTRLGRDDRHFCPRGAISGRQEALPLCGAGDAREEGGSRRRSEDCDDAEESFVKYRICEHAFKPAMRYILLIADVILSRSLCKHYESNMKYDETQIDQG